MHPARLPADEQIPRRIFIDGREYVVNLIEAGVSISCEHYPAQLIKWPNLVDSPRCWAVVSDGWLVEAHESERAASDRVSDLRSVGCAAFTVRVPNGFTLPVS